MNEEMVKLNAMVGDEAYKALLDGHPLKIWRRSTPNNWFIEVDNVLLWHSSYERCERVLPDLNLFTLQKESNNTIEPYFGSDSGKSDLGFYYLKEGV